MRPPAWLVKIAIFVVLVLLVMLPALIAWRIHVSKDPTATANVYAGDLAPVAISVTIVIAMFTWWHRENPSKRSPASSDDLLLARAADQLAEATSRHWRADRSVHRVLGPAPISVPWRRRPDDAAADIHGLPAQGVAADIFDDVCPKLFDPTRPERPRHRLVITGGPASGKSGALTMLLMAALDRRALTPPEHRRGIPVPVWLALGRWNPRRQQLGEVIESAICRDHPYLLSPEFGRDVVKGLVEASPPRVAILLDGLDEMEPEMRVEAVRQLNAAAGDLMIVMTSRSEEYAQLLEIEAVERAVVVELLPVRPDAAEAFLVSDQSGRAVGQWRQVGAELRKHPRSALAKALRDPLALTLARTVYETRDPTELIAAGTGATAVDIRRGLIDQLVWDAYPQPRQRVPVQRLLGWLAHHMDQRCNLAWWKIPRWIPEWQLRSAAGAVTAMCGFTAAALCVGACDGLRAGVTVGAMLGLVLGVVGVLGGGIGGGVRDGFVLRLLDLRHTPSGRPTAASPAGTYRQARTVSLIVGGAVGALVGAGGWVFAGPTAGVTGALVGAVVGTVGGGQAPILVVSGTVLALSNHGDGRILRTLEGARDHGLLRQVGVFYQFRHGELQDRLRDWYRETYLAG